MSLTATCPTPGHLSPLCLHAEKQTLIPHDSEHVLEIICDMMRSFINAHKTTFLIKETMLSQHPNEAITSCRRFFSSPKAAKYRADRCCCCCCSAAAAAAWPPLPSLPHPPTTPSPAPTTKSGLRTTRSSRGHAAAASTRAAATAARRR